MHVPYRLNMVALLLIIGNRNLISLLTLLIDTAVSE